MGDSAECVEHIELYASFSATLLQQLIPLLLDCLSMLSKDVLDKDIIYNVLLVLSGLLTDKKGEEAVIGNAPRIINQLIDLIAYSRSMAVRETAPQCLVAISDLPHTRIYPLRTQENKFQIVNWKGVGSESSDNMNDRFRPSFRRGSITSTTSHATTKQNLTQ